MVRKTIQQLPRQHKLLLMVISAVTAFLLLLPSDPATASRNTQTLELGKRYPLSMDLGPQQTAVPTAGEERQWHVYKVKSGDNLALLFQRAGFTPQETYRVSNAGQQAKKLLKMMPGDELRLSNSDEGTFEALSFTYSPTERLVIERQDTGDYVSRIETKDVEVRLGYATGIIQSSFWNAGVSAGLSENLIMSLASIFGWDIDFALEIRKGDAFNLIYEEEFIDGEFVGYGKILAAEFTNRGERFQAIRYNDGNYYTPQGRSMRKSFLRAPVSFQYISSNFNPNRLHPVLKTRRPHNGIDYAASTGTPVMAAGDGRVIEAGYNRFNGNYVFIQHGEKYVTKYLHFSKRAARRGEHVKQGEIIGYVGATGLASGPHLHYEFLVNGVHRNPRTVELPKARPIAASERDAFASLADKYVEYLDNNRRIMLAMVD